MALDLTAEQISERRAGIAALEKHMLAMDPAEHVSIEPEHFFADGVYARALRIAKGTVVVGKIHKRVHISILAQGDVTITTECGSERIKAPYVVVSPPGMKRVAYAHEDSMWIAVHGTHETDPDRIEDQMIAKSFDELESPGAVHALDEEGL